LAQTDYDVIVFSEAFDNGARKELLKALQPKYPYRTTVVGNGDELNFHQTLGLVGAAGLGAIGLSLTFPVFIGALAGGAFLGYLTGHPKSDGGVFMVSKWPIVFQGQIVYKCAADEDRFGKKGVSWAFINKQGFYFNVFGTHTQADAGYEGIRKTQFRELRNMIDNVSMLWHPVLIAGDLNVDYCFEKDRLAGTCSTVERDSMLNLLQASVPRDLSKFVYTSDPANDMKPDGDKATTLDYVLSSKTHPAPVRSSLETVKLQSPWRSRPRAWSPATDHRDLSDHYAALGTYTFPLRREDSLLFTGTWKCVLFDGKPDTHNHRITCHPFGFTVANDFDGKVTSSRIHQITPGAANKGKIVFRNFPSNQLVEYDYTFNRNPEFDKHFLAGEIRAHRKPKPLNELLLRNRTRSILFAFESWLPVEWERPSGGVV